MHHAFDDKYIHPNWGVNQPQLHRHHDDDAKPNRVKAQLHNHGEDDGNGEDDHGHGVHQAAQNQIHHHDEGQHLVATQAHLG